MPRSKSKRLRRKHSRRNPVKVALVCGLIGAVILALFQLIFNFGEWRETAVHGLAGLFLGLLAAPEFDPEHFKYPVTCQSICGGLAGFIFGVALSYSAGYVALATVVGVVVGATAKWWLDHLPIP